MAKKKNVLILTSGGIDSTACIHYYDKLKFKVEGIFIDYGQPAREKEFKAIKSIASYYDIDIRSLKLRNTINYKGGLIQGRNAFLYFCALMNFPQKAGIISSGIHRGTPYYDCSKKFFDEIQIIVKQYTQDTIRVEAPLLNFNKKEIWDYCLIEKIPLNLTYSCELGRKQPCGKCATCHDLSKLYASKK